jgi:hypothetical protein
LWVEAEAGAGGGAWRVFFSSFEGKVLLHSKKNIENKKLKMWSACGEGDEIGAPWKQDFCSSGSSPCLCSYPPAYSSRRYLPYLLPLGQLCIRIQSFLCCCPLPWSKLHTRPMQFNLIILICLWCIHTWC